MSGLTHLDEMVDYKYEVMSKLQANQMVMGIMSDNPNIDLESDEAEELCNNHFHDYLFIFDTVETARADVMVESTVLDVDGAIKSMEIYVQVSVSANYMKMNYPGIKGNRLDNLCRYIDLALRGSRDFGIGRLQLEDCTIDAVPDDFVSKMLVYKIPDFADDRKLYEN